MSEQSLNAGILIVSETASRDPSTDGTGVLLKEVFATQKEHAWDDSEITIVSDNLSEIQKAITRWTDGPSPKNVVVTSGGTGFAVADTTPEAVNPLIHKHAPGLVHGMLAASLAVTPFALMSRPTAGVRHQSIIITLPGSPKGAKENLEAVVKLLPHACKQAAGAGSRAIHEGGLKLLEKQAGVGRGAEQQSDNQTSHHHHHTHSHSHGTHKVPIPHTKQSSPHKSNNPLEGPSSRQRNSPYPMLSVSEALKAIEENASYPAIIKVPVTPDITGHVIAEDVKAAESVPSFRASIVDGYAIATKSPGTGETNTKGVYPVAFASHAQAGRIADLNPGHIARITTGAPLPPGSNAVVMVEDTILVKKTEDGNEEAEVEILTDEIKPGENVREIGSDVRAGDVVMKKGEGISVLGGEFGLLTSVGTRELSIYEKPIVGVLSTGDEIIPHDRPGGTQLGEVRDTNRPTLLTAIQSCGFRAVDLGIAADKPEELESTLRRSLNTVDVLVTSGGVSMGELDLLKPTLERALGAVIHFGRVSMKPGKPTTFATIPSSNLKSPQTGKRGQTPWPKLVFSLPGNPASAIVTFMLFVLPALHQMSGIAPKGLPRVQVQLETEVSCDNVREEYHRAIVVYKSGTNSAAGFEGVGGLWAASTGGQRSSRIGSFKSANSLLKLPAGGGRLAQGTIVTALLMGPIRNIE